MSDSVHSLWCNDEPAAAGLECWAVAGAAPRLELGVGVLPSTASAGGDRREDCPFGLDPAKLWVGVGSGQLRARATSCGGPLQSYGNLRRERACCAPCDPRLCRLGGAIADGVLLNWMLPAQAALARRWVLEGADEVSRPAPLVASYVRVALGPGALQRLRDEESHYRNINQAHRQHFEGMDAPLGSVGVAAATRSQVLDGLAPYDAALDLRSPVARRGERTSRRAAA